MSTVRNVVGSLNENGYYLGLDIGTDSVGYAVTDETYNLRKFHGEPAWGVTVFEQAGLNTERRAFRVARRRLKRRQQRVQLLQELFAPVIGKIDPGFFKRLQMSGLQPEERDGKYLLFNDAGFTDREYNRQYPTIHHLIVDLMESYDPHDPRLLYLACQWLVLHRGHFLNEIAKDKIDQVTDFHQVYGSLIDYFKENGFQIPWAEIDIDEFGKVLHAHTGINNRMKQLKTICFGKEKPPKLNEDFPIDSEMLLKGLCGGTIDSAKLFENAEYADIRSFTLGSKEEDLAEIMSSLGENAELISRMKAIYDWAILEEILGTGDWKSEGGASISRAKIAVYEQHQEDLKNLKYIVRKYIPEDYSEIFRGNGQSAYTAYSKHGDMSQIKKNVTQEDFCKYILAKIKGIQADAADAELIQSMQERLGDHTFMPKQVNTDNRVIPYQLYWYELDIILKHAQTWLPYLNLKDQDGLTVSDKIRSIMTFRVPYYVGPLNSKSEHSWVVRKAEGRILPWNFDLKVDRDASEQAFIEKLTNTCTYLPGEKVIPKDSLLYHRFTVLNEINNLKINGEGIPVEVKQAIYRDVFLKVRKVTYKRIKEYLISAHYMDKSDALTGIDTETNIKSDLKPWHDFARFLQNSILTEAQVEEIIERRTYSEDAGRFRRWLQNHYGFLQKEDLKYISRLSYHDFGRMSARFLNELGGTDRQTGEIFTVMRALWDTNDNLMQILSDRYTFRDVIEQEQKDYYAEHPMNLTERLDDMYISNAVKRPIIRALDIVQEVASAFGMPPEKIFIEMARGGTPEQKGKRTQARREQIMSLYSQCDEEDVRLLREQLENMGEQADSRLQSDRLFLYYMQLGKCMYTGKSIELDKLMNSKLYDIEHIYPRSKVKDDSIINNKVLVLSSVNGEKSDTYPISSLIRKEMQPFWNKLKELHLISDEKYRRLTRTTPFSDDEKWGFINRQLTETSQATKAVASVIRDLYPETEIVYVKARLASEFRQEFNCVKCRTYNDLHHAKDAYLNIVVGNVYNMRFTRQWFRVQDEYSLRTEVIFTRPLICNGKTIWDGVPMKDKAVAYMGRNHIHFSKYPFCKKGGFFDQMPVKAGEGQVPRKEGLSIEKYGGYNKPSVSFYTLVRYQTGKKKDIMLVPVELMSADRFMKDPVFAQVYLQKRISFILGKSVDHVERLIKGRILKVGTILSFDGFEACISGTSGGGKMLILEPIIQFVHAPETERYLKRLESLTEKVKNNPKYRYDEHFDGVNTEENLKLYDLYILKAEKTIYSKRMNMPAEVLRKGRDQFAQESAIKQAEILLNIHSLFTRNGGGGCDLLGIGGAKRAAVTTMSTGLSNWKKNYSSVKIVDRSTAGLWEQHSCNLLELL